MIVILYPCGHGEKKFSEVHDNLVEGSVSDNGLSRGKRRQLQSRASSSRNISVIRSNVDSSAGKIKIWRNFFEIGKSQASYLMDLN